MSFNMFGYKLPDLLLGPTLYIAEHRVITEMLYEAVFGLARFVLSPPPPTCMFHRGNVAPKGVKIGSWWGH